MNKGVSIFLIMTMLAGGLFFPVPRAAAQSGKVVESILNTGIDPICDGFSAVKDAISGKKDEYVNKGKDELKKEGKEQAKKEIADELGKELGIEFDSAVPTRDVTKDEKIAAVQKNTEEIKATDTKLSCKEFLRKTLLSSLKKYILDRMANDIIKWIQNGESPRFVENTGEFFADAGKAAVGELAQEVGLGFLCKPYNLQVQLSLLAPQPFSERTRCTLDDIESNFDNFKRNFSSAGWLGYNELLKPANNRWGVQLLTQDELINRQYAKQEAAKVQLMASQGFLGTSRCVAWSFIDLRTQKNSRFVVNDVNPEDYGFDNWPVPDPNTDPALSKELNTLLPPDTDRIPSDKTASLLGNIPPNLVSGKYTWKCDKREVTTPGRTVADTLTRGITAEIDYVANSEDLTNYLAMFADAAISRLTKEAVGGIKDLYKGGNTDSPPQGSIVSVCDDYMNVDSVTGVRTESPLSRHCRSVDAEGQNVLSASVKNVARSLDDIELVASSTERGIARARAANNELVALLGTPTGNPGESLIACLIARNQLSGVATASGTLDNALTKTKTELDREEQALINIKASLADVKTRYQNLGVVDDSYVSRVLELKSDILELRGQAASVLELIEADLSNYRSQYEACLLSN